VAQDEVSQTHYHATRLVITPKYRKCRVGQKFGETSDHIVSTCPLSAKEHCMTRQERMYAQLRFNIANKAMFEVLLVLGHFHFLLLCKVGFEIL